MRRLLLSALFLTAHALAAQSKLAKPVIDTVNHHIVRVMSGGPTAWADTSGWRLVYERTVQPPDGSTGMLERPRQILLLPDGSLIAAQRNPAVIKLYDPQGKFVRNIGREGAGPGEFRAPQLVLFRDTLVIHDANLGRAALWTADGKFVRQFLTNVHYDGPPVSMDDKGRLRVQTPRASAGMFGSQWTYFDLTGKRVDSIVPPEVAKVKNWEAKVPGGFSQSSVPFSPFNFYAFLRDGSIVYGGTDRYLMFVTRTGHDTVRMFGRTGLDVIAIPAAVRDSQFRSATQDPNIRAVAAESDIPRTYALWGGFSVDGNGNTWVVPGGPPWAAAKWFDVFDPSGRFLGAVPAPFAAFSFASWASNRVAVLDNDENGLPRVRIFRVDRRGK